MRSKTKVLITGAGIAAAIAAGAGVAGAGVAGASGSDDSEQPITGADLQRASQVALAHTGGGTVTETEVGDEESYYVVEVNLDGGRQVDVQLDRGFTVVGSDSDGGDAAGGQD